MRVLVALIIAVAAAFSASADIFTVTGVRVDATAESAAAARERAIADGQRRAAQILIQRLTLDADRAALAPLDASGAALLVAGFEVNDESARGQRYIADMTVAFAPSEVRDYLRSAGVPFVDSAARPVVIAPVLMSGGQARLWQSNPWLDAWSGVNLENELVPVITPTGDLNDIRAVRASDAANLDVEGLRQLAAGYGAERVVVARATGPSSATLTRIDFAADGAVRELGSVSGGDYASLVAASAGLLQREWKNLTIVRSTSTSELAVSVLYQNSSQWLTLRNSLGGSSLISNARLDAMANSGAMMFLRHRGRVDQLEAELAERGVVLAQDPQIGWTVRLASAAPRPYRSVLPPPAEEPADGE